MTFAPRRSLAVVALATLAACAAVTGLGDYDIVDLVDGAAPDGNVRNDVALVPNDAPSAADRIAPTPEDASADAPRIDADATEAASPDDATSDARTGQSGVYCVDGPCRGAGVHCCAAFSLQHSCTSSACGVNEGTFECDDGFDCAPGTVCCTMFIGVVSSAKCAASCSSPQEMVCTSDAQCAEGTCKARNTAVIPNLKTCQ